MVLPVIVLALAAAPATGPATAPTRQQIIEQRKLDVQKEEAGKILGLPALPQKRLDELLTFSIVNGELMVSPRVGRTDRSVAPIRGLPGTTIFAIGGDQPNTPDGATWIQLEYTDLSHRDEVFRRTQVFASAASIQISRDLEALSGSQSVSLIQSYNPDEADTACRLYVQVFAALTDELQTKLTLMAPNFVELRKRYPREVRQYLDPMLRDLQQASTVLAPDAKLANQVFGQDAAPETALTEKINAAVAKFDADDFKLRQSAANALKDIGEPAALVLRHADRTGWSIDRRNGVDAFLAQFDSKPPAETAQLKSNPAFLLDCLYSDDASTRSSAATQLQKIAGSEVSLPPDANPAARAELVDQLYPGLFKPVANPATQP